MNQRKQQGQQGSGQTARSRRFGVLWQRCRQQAGQGIVEYTWILVLVSVVAVLLLRVIGSTTNNLLADTNANMPR